MRFFILFLFSVSALLADVCSNCMGAGKFFRGFSWDHCNVCDGDGQVDSDGLGDQAKNVISEVTDGPWEDLFANGYVSVSNLMESWNQNQTHDFRWCWEKEILRNYYSNLNETALIYNASLADEWTVLGQVVSYGSAAQVFGNNVYINGTEKAWDYGRLALLAHEFQHVRQYRRAGGLYQFGQRYGLGYKHAGFDYASNEMEVEARTSAQNIITELESRWDEALDTARSGARQVVFAPDGSTAVLQYGNGYSCRKAPDDFVQKLQSIGEEITSVSIGQGEAWVIFHGTNGYSYSGIPEALANALREQNTAGAVFKSVSLGPGGYFAFFYGDSYTVVGPQNLYDALQTTSDWKQVTFTAQSGWVLLHGTGAWWSGIPENLGETLKQATRVESVGISPVGDWIITTADGFVSAYDEPEPTDY